MARPRLQDLNQASLCDRGDDNKDAAWRLAAGLPTQRLQEQPRVSHSVRQKTPTGAWRRSCSVRRRQKVPKQALVCNRGDGDKDTDWRLAAERIGAAVQAIAPRLLVFAEGVEKNCFPVSAQQPANWGGALDSAEAAPVDLPAARNKLVYSPHVYGPGEASLAPIDIYMTLPSSYQNGMVLAQLIHAIMLWFAELFLHDIVTRMQSIGYILMKPSSQLSQRFAIIVLKTSLSPSSVRHLPCQPAQAPGSIRASGSMQCLAMQMSPISRTSIVEPSTTFLPKSGSTSGLTFAIRILQWCWVCPSFLQSVPLASIIPPTGSPAYQICAH